MENVTKILKVVWKGLSSLIPLALLIIVGVFSYRYFDENFFQSHSYWAPPIFNGVISGGVTAVLLIILSVTLRSHIRPLLENLQYKGVKIEGVWNGVLVPYIGVDEIDKDRIRIGMAEIRRRKKAREKSQKAAENSKSTKVSASALDVDGVTRDIKAELITENESPLDEPEPEVVKRRFFIAVSKFTPIEVRAQFERSGHDVTGEVVEIGGASDIHTYSIRGSFKNLILTGEYENNHSGHIDRGSLSLMLVKNGKEFRGFFASYADNDHRIIPFRCVLKRHGMDQDGETYNKSSQQDASKAGASA